MVLFFTVGVSALSIIGIYSYFNAKNALLKRTLDQLTSIRVIKKGQIEFFFNERFNNIKLLSENDYLKKLVSDLTIGNHSRESDKAYFKAISEKLDYRFLGYNSIYLIITPTDGNPKIFKVQGSEIMNITSDSATNFQLLKLREKTITSNEPSIVDFSKPTVNDNEPYVL